MEFPDTYIDHPPKKVIMKTKIYHPNIDSKGRICLGDIKEAWDKNKMNAKFVIEFLANLLKQPDFEGGLVPGIVKQYKEDPKKFEKQAKEWTNEYAM